MFSYYTLKNKDKNKMLALRVQALSKTYKNGFIALKKINLDIKKGQFLALLGKNGAGKTTFVEILSSLTKKTAGTVTIHGKDLDDDPAFIKACTGMVPQEFNLAIFETVLQILITQAGYFGIKTDSAYKTAKKLLIALDLWEKRNNAVVELSGGMKRRLMIARALMHNPSIIFLDEPTAGVDIQVRQKIWTIMKDLNKQGKTIILTTHYFEEAEKLCDSLAIIAKGKIIMHDSLKKIFDKCPKQKYIIELDPKHNLNVTADNITSLSKRKLQVLIDKDYTLSSSLEKILSQGAKINSAQPQNTRLEDLFLNISH